MTPDLRTSQALMDGWYLSISAADAQLAARTRQTLDASQLELADDPDNLPVCIRLPGDSTLGLRPLDGDLPPRDASGKRLPNPFVSYAKAIDIPAAWAGRTLRLCLDYARYHVTVTIDGEQVAHYIGGQEPHTIDITDAVTPGQTAMLCITVGDSGTSGHRPFDTHIYTGTRLPACEEITDNLTHPVAYGGADRAVGIVQLEALPKVRVDHVILDPRIAAGELRARLVLRNDSDTPAAVAIDSSIVGEHALYRDSVEIPARETVTIDTVDTWPDAILWDTDNPHLYELQTRLTIAGDAVDCHRESFGMREFTINGPDFYLNGKKIHLHGQSGHTHIQQDYWTPLEEKMAILRAWKDEGHVNHIRLHAKPQDRGWVLAADRVGMLITTETAMWTTNFYSFDFVGSEEACYQNIRNHFFAALVERDRNNPSVILWSLTNEMSPITPFDLDNPKMAAMTRILERIVGEAREVPGARIIQMSSAVDFLGRLDLYNLHYPKNWQAFPDYPRTACWLDEGFLFPWYGPRREELPPWSWRRDKPLIFGEFTCVYGATPDNQAAIVGDVAFERQDFGTPLVHEKLWPMEMRAYRRQDVSGFTAWACMTWKSLEETRAALQRPEVQAHTRALRPLAVLDHTYRTRYFAGEAATVALSIHNDTRHPRSLALTVEAHLGDRRIGRESWPPAIYGPAELRNTLARFRLPAELNEPAAVTIHVTLTADGDVVDQWRKELQVSPRPGAEPVPRAITIVDPGECFSERLQAHGIPWLQPKRGARTWLVSFEAAAIRPDDWADLLPGLEAAVEDGANVVLDNPPDWVLESLPAAIERTPGFGQDGELEITYAFVAAPHHAVLQGLSDNNFALWGNDGYVAHGCFQVPEDGSVIPLLLAGTDRGGLTASPLLEVRQGEGAWLLSRLELIPKLAEEPRAADLLARLCAYSPSFLIGEFGVAAGPEVLRRLREVGYDADPVEPEEACNADVSLIATDTLTDELLDDLALCLDDGCHIILHGLTEAQTRQLLTHFKLEGEVIPGKAEPREWDTFRHDHWLADGMSNNHLYWIVDKAKVAMWTAAPLHPEPATACIRLPDGADKAWSLTRRGAVTVYKRRKGLLIVDNLRWELDLDEPERPRRYLKTLLSNLGVALQSGQDAASSDEYETAAERRERGHF